MAEALVAMTMGSAGTGAAASAIPSGMATAGGMASGVGAAGAGTASSVLPGLLESLAPGMLKGAAPILGGKVASSILGGGGRSGAAPPRQMGGFSMRSQPIGSNNPAPVPAIGGGGGAFGKPTGELELLLKALMGGR